MRQSKPHFGDFGEHDPCEILNAGWSVEQLHLEIFARPAAMVLQCFVQCIVDVDEHAVVVKFLQPWINLFVKGTKQSADVAVTFDLKKTTQAVAMPMQIAALVFERFVAVCCVKLVVFLDDHNFTCSSTRLMLEMAVRKAHRSTRQSQVSGIARLWRVELRRAGWLPQRVNDIQKSTRLPA